MNIFIHGKRNGYSPDQCGITMNVGELIEYLSDFDPQSNIYLKNDNGYTYGSITWCDIETNENEDCED